MRLRVYEDKRVTVEESEPARAEKSFARFSVKACGICGSDIPRVFAGASYYYPIVLGHEFAGVVADSENKELIGKRAAVFPILPCGKCEFCKREEWANCVSYDYYGSRRDGGFQNELSVKESNLVFLPDNVSFEAGAMIEPCAVTLHAVKKASINKDTVVRVYGAGTIGLLCAMWARAFGASEIYVSDPDEARLSFAESLGFRKSDDEKPDRVIDASGAPGAVNEALRDIKAFGTLVLVGNAHGDMPLGKAEYSQLLRKQLSVIGSWNSDFRAEGDDWNESAQAISGGLIEPERLITHRFDLAEAHKAFELIGERKELYNKIMVVM